MGQKQQDTITQKSEPWGPIQGQLKQAADWNEQAFKSGALTPSPLGGQFSDEAMQSMQMTMDRANRGAPLIDKASGYLTQMMDPYKAMQGFTKTISNDVLDDVIPAATSQFAGSGMGNSTLAMDTVGDAASTAVTNAVAPYYDAALNRGMQAAGMAPSMEAAGYLPAQMVGQVGSQIDAMDEALANSEMQGFQTYLNNVAMLGGMGGKTSETQPGVSTGARIGSAGLTGLGTYGALVGAGAPFAAPLAAGAGLLGLLG